MTTKKTDGKSTPTHDSSHHIYEEKRTSAPPSTLNTTTVRKPQKGSNVKD